GVALVTVLLVMTVLTLLITALCQYSIADALHAVRDEKRMQAHYIARSGAAATAAWLNSVSKEERLSLADKTSETQAFGNGTFTVSVYDISESQITMKLKIISEGIVDGVKDIVNIILRYTEPGALPPPEEIEYIFPDDFDFENDWTEGTDVDEGTGWVNLNTGNIKSDTVFTDEQGNYVSVSFPEGIIVEHQESQQTFRFYTTYMIFENPEMSLYIKQGNTLELHSNIIVFKGNIWLDGDHAKNYGKLQLHVVDLDNCTLINGYPYGKVYFYEDLLYGKNINNLITLVPAGAYYYRHGLILRGKPEIIPSLEDGLIPIGSEPGAGGSDMNWQ
ncbi:MAG: hypothetical protein CVU88_02860, partial [Firmicutes bacterium HGW-Firmicutes-13]